MELPRTLNVLTIQVRIAAGSPSAWQDGIVESVTGQLVAIRRLDGSAMRLRVADTEGLPTAGDPVAYHPIAEILSGSVRTTARFDS